MANNINIDNENLKYNASRLNNITKRISSLDSQISRLYWQTGHLDVWKIMQSNILYTDNKKIKNCINTLNIIANEFESTEKSVNSGGLLLNRLDTLGSFKPLGFWQRIYISIKNSIEKVGKALKKNVAKITNLLLKYKTDYLTGSSIKNNVNVGSCVITAANAVRSIFDRIQDGKEPVITVIDGRPIIETILREAEELDLETDGNLKTYSYGNQDFSVIKGLDQKYCYNQNDYNRFWSNTYNDNVGCTSTAEAIAYSIYHNEEVSPNEMGWGSNGAKWNHSKTIEGTTNCSAEHTYKTIYENVKNGTPVMFRVKNAAKQNYGHHMTAVGIRDGADPNNLGPADILVVDPEKGKIETLADYTKGSYNKNTIIDNDGWPLRIPV